MRIRSQLVGFVVGSILLTLGATLAVLAASRREDAAREVQARAQVTAHEVAGLLTLTLEYARYSEPRAAQQWHQRHSTLSVALNDEVQETLGGAALVELRAVAQALPPLFSRLESIQAGDDAFTVRRREALFDQLLTSTQAMSDEADQWFQHAARVRRDAEQNFHLIALATPCLMLAVLIGMAWVVRSRVLAPMKRLEHAAGAVRDGDLSFRLASRVADEFGDLSRQFDTMTAALAASSARLQQSQKQLRAITDNLPVLIAYIDSNEVYRFTNAHYKAVFDVEPESFLGTTVAQSLGPAAYADLKTEIDGVLRGERRKFERHGRERGIDIHFLVDYIPDTESDGTVAGFYVMVADITARKEAELRTARSEQRLVDLMNNIPAMVGYFDMEERCQYANETGLRSLGVEPSDVPGIFMRDALGEAIYAQHEPFVKQALQGRRTRLDGKTPFRERQAYFQAHLIPDRVEGGAQRGFYLMTFDITALKEAEQRQAVVDRRLRAITDNLPVLITYIDRDWRYGFVNQTAKEWLGIEPEEAMGQQVEDVMPHELYMQRYTHIERALAGERVSFTVESESMGVMRSLQLVYIPDILADGSVAGIYTLSTDVSPLKNVERQLSLLARSDTLTGLPNRYQFNEVLPLALARSRRSGAAIALMFLDIDHFKSINDTFGHATGDFVLREFARRLLGSVRSTDTVARLAGDEFVIVLEGLNDPAEAEFVARKILAAMRLPFDADGRWLDVSTSVGIVYQPMSADAATTPAQLLAEADEALYAAKHAGRGTYRMALGGQPAETASA
jgi:diguanylate cyclase (GGDEF)-like protein/PAS domain S-box-containing protein